MRRDRLAENIAQVLARGGREELHVGHVEPDDQPEPIGQLEVELVGDLDVAPQRIEPHRLGVSEPLLQKRLIGVAAILLGIPILVERAEHVEGPAVQEQPSVARFEKPEADAPLDRVHDRRV